MTAQIRSIKSYLKNPPSRAVRKRLQIVLFKQQGFSVTEISHLLNVSLTKINPVLNKYKKEGLEGFKRDPYQKGKTPKLKGEQLEEVAAWFGDPNSLEYFFKLEDCRKAVKRIKAKWGIEIKPATLYVRLRSYERAFHGKV